MLEIIEQFFSGQSSYGTPFFNGLLYDLLPNYLYPENRTIITDFGGNLILIIVMTILFSLITYLIYSWAKNVEQQKGYGGLKIWSILAFNLLLIVLFGINNYIITGYLMIMSFILVFISIFKFINNISGN